VPLPAAPAGRRGAAGPVGDPAVAFLEEHLLVLDAASVADAAAVWSVEPRHADRFERAEARRVWALRLRLSPAGQAAFDALPVGTRAQLAELYDEVLAPGMAVVDGERPVAG
jgi:hypothetical protein